MLEELINNLLKWNLSKALTSAQKLHWRTTTFEERLPTTASALKHVYDIIKIMERQKFEPSLT